MPLANPVRLDHAFQSLFGKADAIQDPFEQAFFVMVHLPYLQPFEDVNKRVSRLATNIPFIQTNLTPLSFMDVPDNIYITGLLGVYELNRFDLLRDFFVWTYERSCRHFSTLRSVKRLNAEEQNNSFVGSDFTNGDIAGRQVSRDRHKITGDDDEKIYIESRPKDSADLYFRMEVEMLRRILVPARIVFYDRGGTKLKTLFNARIKKIKGMYLVTESVMTNHQAGSSTTIRKSAIDLTRKISEHQVGIKGLRN